MDDAGRVAVLVCGVREVERRSERVRDVRGQPDVQRLSALAKMAQCCAKVGALDELEREVVRSFDDPKGEDPRDVAVVQQSRKARLA